MNASTAQPDFSRVVASLMTRAADAVAAGEATAATGMSGQASVQEVALAVIGAEQHLHAALAIRDRAVAAYQEISRTAI